MKAVREMMRRAAMWRAYHGRRTRLDYPPLEVWVEPTNHCNLRCVKCPHAVGLKRERGYMDLDFFREVVDEIAPYAFTISLQLGGESLLHQDLPAMVRAAAERGLRTVLHTNATLLDAPLSRALIESGLRVLSISFDGEDSESYERLDAGGKWEKTLEAIRTFHSVRSEIGSRYPFTVLQTLRMTEELAEIDPVRSPLARLGADYFKISQPHAWSGSFAREHSALIPLRVFEKSRAEANGYSPCHHLWYGIVVFWNGRVAPCCLDMEGEVEVGRLGEQSLRELWNGETMVSLRERLVAGRYDEIDLCRGCAYLWGKARGSVLQDARNAAKQALRERAPRLARWMGAKPYGVHSWHG